MDGGFLTVALNIGICGLFDGFSLAQVVYLLDEKLPVESVRMVKIDGMALLVRHACGVVIVRVEWHHGYMMRRKSLHNFLYNGGLA